MTPLLVNRMSQQAAARAFLNNYLVDSEKLLSGIRDHLTEVMKPSREKLLTQVFELKVNLDLDSSSQRDCKDILSTAELDVLLAKALNTVITTAISTEENPLPEPIQVTVESYKNDESYKKASVRIALF